MEVRNPERLQEVYIACLNHVDEYHNFPSYRWLIINTDITSTSMVNYYLEKLEEMKMIKRYRYGKTTRWKIVGSTWTPPKGVTDA